MDLLKINNCYQKSEKTFFINADIEDENSDKVSNSNINYEIVTKNFDECKNYVNALNYVSQLVKCKMFAYKNNEKK